MKTCAASVSLSLCLRQCLPACHSTDWNKVVTPKWLRNMAFDRLKAKQMTSCHLEIHAIFPWVTNHQLNAGNVHICPVDTLFWILTFIVLNSRLYGRHLRKFPVSRKIPFCKERSKGWHFVSGFHLSYFHPWNVWYSVHGQNTGIFAESPGFDIIWATPANSQNRHCLVLSREK